ncbi:MAG TPA: hypothetical protein VML35_05020 [Gaiellaceae bacterium]|nr:hypothetical protein [Gaiellaceae bacterium]
MDTQISPQVRLVAIIGLVAALAGGGGIVFMNRTAAADAVEPAAQDVTQNAALLPVPAEPKPKAEPAPAQKAAPPKPVPAAEPAEPAPTVDEHGLPLSISAALKRSEIVVVTLFAPGGTVDGLALAEARAGAREAGAAFVAVNVLERTQGIAIARLLGVAESPATLVYRSPADLAFRFDGFADLVTVAQGVTNARALGAGGA